MMQQAQFVGVLTGPYYGRIWNHSKQFGNKNIHELK